MVVRGAALLGVLFGVLVTTAAVAKSIYTYRDANGVLHFTDQPPPEGQQGVERRLVRTEAPLRVHLREEALPGAKQRWHLRNDYGGPIELVVRATTAENVLTAPDLPARVVIPGLSERTLLTATGASPFNPWQLEFSYQLMFGDPRAVPDPDADYQLPFDYPPGAEIHQAWGGRFSHTDPENFHAVDFSLPVGTPILAARAGTVLEVNDDHFESGLDVRLATRANSVRIVHADGTMAVYAHLKHEAGWVRIGDRVRAGQQIALSGNVGFSSGPHLHFVVQRNAGMRLESVPFHFRVGEERIEPRAGLRLGQRPR